MAEKKTFTKEDVVNAWSEKAGRKDQYDVREVKSEDGADQVQLIDKDTGSISIAVDGSGSDAFRKLVEQAGTPLIDGAEMPQESVGAGNNEQHFTSRGVLATPTQPEALEGTADAVEFDTSKARGDEPTRPEERISSTNVPAV